MADKKPIVWGSTDEVIFQALARSVMPLSTNDVYQRCQSLGIFTDTPRANALRDIGKKLEAMRASRGLESNNDNLTGVKYWSLSAAARATLPKAKAEPSVPPKPKPDPKEILQADTPRPKRNTLTVEIPSEHAVIWADALNDLTYDPIIKTEITRMFGALECAIRAALPSEVAHV